MIMVAMHFLMRSALCSLQFSYTCSATNANQFGYYGKSPPEYHIFIGACSRFHFRTMAKMWTISLNDSSVIFPFLVSLRSR